MGGILDEVKDKTKSEIEHKKLLQNKVYDYKQLNRDQADTENRDKSL